MNKSAKKLLDLIGQIEAVKEAYRDEVKKINADDSRSDKFKAAERAKAKEEAAAKLGALSESASEHVDRLKSDYTYHFTNFDYTDPRIMAAVQLIKTTGGKNLPASAWEQMRADFATSPASLEFLANTANEVGAHEGSITLQEDAKAGHMAETFPDRLSDSLYFAGNPEAGEDFSGWKYELAQIGEVIADDTERSVAARIAKDE